MMSWVLDKPQKELQFRIHLILMYGTKLIKYVISICFQVFTGHLKWFTKIQATNELSLLKNESFAKLPFDPSFFSAISLIKTQSTRKKRIQQRGKVLL